MQLITQEQLKALQPNQAISGVILVKNYDTQLTKGNKEYEVGYLQSGIDIGFKAWGNSLAFKELKENDYTNCPSYITGTVDNWGGTMSIIVDSIQAVEGFTPDMFFPLKYNIDAYFNALEGYLSSKLSQKGLDLVKKIFFENTVLIERFKVEFAAMNHHDNCKGGLLAHTYKTLCNVGHIIFQYKDLYIRGGETDADFVDLLYIGALLHDIGKVDEMNFGVYTSKSIVTHRYLGVEYIAPYKDMIISTYNENWYYELISIMLQHHGQWGEPCKTIASYIINKADELDAYLTDLCQAVEVVNNEYGQKIRVDGSYLFI